MIYIYLLFPFVYAKYIIFEKRSLTFQCTGLSRLAKICLRESPESKMTHVKYNCASLCNIVKERTAWNIVTQYIINDRHDHGNLTKKTSFDVQTLTYLRNHIPYLYCLKSHNAHYAAFYPVSKGLFNVSKITKEHMPSRLCSNFIFFTLSRFLPAGYKHKFC